MQGTLLILVVIGAPLWLVGASYLGPTKILPAENVPSPRAAMLHSRLAHKIQSSLPAIPQTGFLSQRAATLVMFSPILLAAGLLGYLSGLIAREEVRARFEFSSPTVFMMARGIIALSLALAWSYIFLPIKIPIEILLVPAAALYAGLRASAKHFPSVW